MTYCQLCSVFNNNMTWIVEPCLESRIKIRFQQANIVTENLHSEYVTSRYNDTAGKTWRLNSSCTFAITGSLIFIKSFHPWGVCCTDHCNQVTVALTFREKVFQYILFYDQWLWSGQKYVEASRTILAVLKVEIDTILISNNVGGGKSRISCGQCSAVSINNNNIN